MNNERIILDAIITETHRGGLFSAKLDNDDIVMARPSGKMQQNMINIIVGDKVKVEVSPYDFLKGRIISRLR